MITTAAALAATALLATTACSSDAVGGTGSGAGSPSAAPVSSAPAPTPSESFEDPGTAAKSNPCSLVTQQEADAIAGTKLMPKMRAQQLCTFATPTSGAVGQLEVYVGDGAKKYYDIDKIDLGHTFRTVPGVGDEAHLEDGAIFVKAKGTWVGLRLLRLDDVDTGPSLIKLAGIAIGRLA
ncbi:MAG: hypothetical protein ACTHMS_14260 [Jatrophihabitans sp.]|uniref:hypothetical protein n=1 Tax=Jatrophihabitans sp. TaxID=1932789 RepID=UPI003F808F17